MSDPERKPVNGGIHSNEESRETRLTLPSERYRLEEINLAPALAASLEGKTITVKILPAEEAGTRRVDPVVESSWWVDPEGTYWNDFQPLRVLFTDPDGRVWRLRRRWLRPIQPEPRLDAICPVFQAAIWQEQMNMPTEWDIQEVNVGLIEARRICGSVAVVQAHANPGEPVKVFWRDSSGALWRIPHDWRRRTIKLPGYDLLVSQEIDPYVAREYAGAVVSVNYHPGSFCCLPDAYRFRDREGNRWPVRIQDVVLLGYGDGVTHLA
jgi:hypothetical protein